MISWNLSIQRAITNNIVLDAAYVGNHGTKFMNHVDLNQADPAANFWGQPSNGVRQPELSLPRVTRPKTTTACDGSALSDLLFASRPYNTKFPYLNTHYQLGERGLFQLQRPAAIRDHAQLPWRFAAERIHLFEVS